MALPSSEAIRQKYEQVLEESLASAVINIGDDDEAAEKVRQSFESCIPSELPAELLAEAEAGNPKIAGLLKERAARELMTICSSEFGPGDSSRAFATAVAQKATDWINP